MLESLSATPFFWMAASSSSWAALLSVTLSHSLPLLLAGLGGLYSERSGIVNIGLEGMMLVGAFAAAWVGVAVGGSTGSHLLGLVMAGIAGGALATIHAVLCVRMRADQIISGVALNILALQGTLFCSVVVFGSKGGSKSISPIHDWKIFGLDLSPLLLLTLLLLGLTAFVLHRTTFGLRLRACGEHPSAARSAGIAVSKMRFIAVIISGVLAGLGGAFLVHEAAGFTKDMSAGRGYIALAALVFSGWRAVPLSLACLLFGFAYALNFQLQNSGATLKSMPWLIGTPLQWFKTTFPVLFSFLQSSQFLSMLPFLVTILALVGLVKKTRPPAALGLEDSH
jgi:simple sugar transport system permease protein